MSVNKKKSKKKKRKYNPIDTKRDSNANSTEFFPILISIIFISTIIPNEMILIELFQSLKCSSNIFFTMNRLQDLF